MVFFHWIVDIFPYFLWFILCKIGCHAPVDNSCLLVPDFYGYLSQAFLSFLWSFCSIPRWFWQLILFFWTTASQFNTIVEVRYSSQMILSVSALTHWFFFIKLWSIDLFEINSHWILVLIPHSVWFDQPVSISTFPFPPTSFPCLQFKFPTSISFNSFPLFQTSSFINDFIFAIVMITTSF